jgi:transcriptional regulator GlxA family with amidase domain
MDASGSEPIQALIVAVPETAGSALYGMVDVLAATGNLWQSLVGTEPARRLIRPRIVAPSAQPFRCGNGIPVSPDLTIGAAAQAEIVVLPELWLAPDQDLKGRYPELMEWIRARYREGAMIYSACSGSIMLAETGLLRGRVATSHWGYEELFRRSYPEVKFRPEPNLAFADAAGRIVTAGGTTSWHDLAIHIIARHCNPGEALRIAKVYLLKWHGEGQLPYTTLVRRSPHADSAVRSCERWLAEHFALPNPVQGAVDAARLPERTLKRRFKSATGSTLIDCRTCASRRPSGCSRPRRPPSTRSARRWATRTRASSAGCSGAAPGSRQASTAACSGRSSRARQPMTCPRWHGPARVRARAISGPDCPRQTARSRA